MRRSLSAALVTFTLVPQLLGAQSVQSVDELAPGTRVRITAPGTPKRPATLVMRRADALVVRWEHSTDSASVPLPSISRLEVSAGWHRSVLRNGAIGALIGGVSGAILGAASYSPCTDSRPFECLASPADSRGQSAALGAIAGGGLGAIIGSVTGLPKHEHWQRVSTATNPAVASLVPSVHGATVRVALHF